MAKLLVTGGAGVIGSNLGYELVKIGHKVVVIDNLSGGKRENVNSKAKFYRADVTNMKQIKPIFRGVDYVFHLAALPRVQFSIEHPLESDAANVRGTLNVLVAAADAGVKRVIYSASSSAYGDQKIMPLRENFLANPKSPYGLQKYIGELYCKIWSEVYGLPTVCLRYFNVYGHRQSHEGAYALVIAKFIKQKLSGQPMTITGDGKHTRDFTNVKDVVRANILAMRSRKVGKGEVVNIGAGNNQSILRVARLIGGPIKFISARLEPRDTLADISKAKRLLNWQPRVSLKDWIKKQIVIK